MKSLERIIVTALVAGAFAVSPVLGANVTNQSSKPYTSETKISTIAEAIPSYQSKIAFISERDGNAEIYVMSVDGSDQKRLTRNSTDDFARSWSPDGKKIAFCSNRDGNGNLEILDIYVMNADGSEQKRLTNNPTIDADPSWSPDGKKIAFCSNRDGNQEIYVMNADGSEQRNLTNNPAAADGNPSWSPDGKKIAFSSDRDGNWEIYVTNADGSDQKRLTNNPAGDWVPSWSPDGKKIAFCSERDGNRDVHGWSSSEIYVMNADGSDQKRLTNNPAGDWYPSWSPDGKKIAFCSERDGNAEIYVMNADGSDQKRLTNNLNGDWYPSWSPFLKTETKPPEIYTPRGFIPPSHMPYIPRDPATYMPHPWPPEIHQR